jgi:3-oxoacyl-[acyl-carrier protein] reductase
MGKDSIGVAIVTGATRGLGREIAVQLAKDGYDIGYCYYQNSELANQLAKEIETLGRRQINKQINVADFNQVQEFVQEAEHILGTTSVLVNNAGIIRDSPLVMMDYISWKEVIDINLTGTFNFCRSVIFNFMKNKCGSIINISSVSGIYGNKSQTNYSASKAGIIGFSKALAKEVGDYGVRVNVVAPGFISTDMTDSLSQKNKEKVKSMIPLDKFGEPEDVANVVSFLASDKAKYITCQVFQVDGGLQL